MMNELGWKPLNVRRKEQRLGLLFKILNDLVAIPADNNIEYNQRPSRTSNSSLNFPSQCLRFLLMNPRVELALLQIVLIYVDHFKFSLMITPRYEFSWTCSKI
jgi:hypothetical protein